MLNNTVRPIAGAPSWAVVPEYGPELVGLFGADEQARKQGDANAKLTRANLLAIGMRVPPECSHMPERLVRGDTTAALNAARLILRHMPRPAAFDALRAQGLGLLIQDLPQMAQDVIEVLCCRPDFVALRRPEVAPILEALSLRLTEDGTAAPATGTDWGDVDVLAL